MLGGARGLGQGKLSEACDVYKRKEIGVMDVFCGWELGVLVLSGGRRGEMWRWGVVGSGS